MFDVRSKILTLIDQGVLAPSDAEAAMEAAGVFPSEESWHQFIGRLLLWLGVLSMAIGVVFFVAFNWDALGKIGKFLLVEGMLIASLLPLLWHDTSSRIGGLALLGAGILVGALLALFGQTYQTGADTWQLFATWAVLILPWVLLTHFEALWLLWIGVSNLAIGLYAQLFAFDIFPTDVWTTTLLLFWNFFIVVMYEYTLRSKRHLKRTGIYFPAIIMVIAATWVGLWTLLGWRHTFGGFFPLYLAWLAIHCWVYRRHIRDLLMLTAGCFSAIIVMIAFLGSHVDINAISAFVLAIALIAMGSGAATWLKHTAQSWQEDFHVDPQD